MTCNPGTRIDEFSEFKELNCSYLPLEHLIVVDKEKKKEIKKKKERNKSPSLPFLEKKIIFLCLNTSNDSSYIVTLRGDASTPQEPTPHYCSSMSQREK